MTMQPNNFTDYRTNEDDDEQLSEAGGSEYGGEEAVEESVLLSLINSYDWAGALARVATCPSETRIRGEQGRTPLLVACDHDAPAVVIQSLLKAYPEATLLVGTSKMNALHITCSSNHASVHVVRMLLEGGKPEQSSMRDVDGDTPLHTACRCGAPIEVLEVLLRANPDAVHVRDYEGLTPLLRLWVRYTVILGDDAIQAVNCLGDLNGEMMEAWNKTELLLRCAHLGELEDENASQVFRAVHAASAIDCPRAIVKIATKIYPHQLGETDELGRTPLLIAAATPVYKVRDLTDNGYTLEDIIHGDGLDEDVVLGGCSEESTENATQPSVIEILLAANQEGASSSAIVPDAGGRLPLHLALASKKVWGEGVKQLVEVYPESLLLWDQTARLYPFMLAAEGSDRDLNTIYEVIRLNPVLIADLCLRH